MMAIQKLQSGPLHLLVAWSFTWAISHFCWWPMCKRWGQAFVKVKWWKLDYSDIQIICRKLATSTKWAYWFVSSSCTLTICFRCFFQVFFLFCHAFRFHLDKYSGGPTGTAWGMARIFSTGGHHFLNSKFHGHTIFHPCHFAPSKVHVGSHFLVPQR